MSWAACAETENSMRTFKHSPLALAALFMFSLLIADKASAADAGVQLSQLQFLLDDAQASIGFASTPNVADTITGSASCLNLASDLAAQFIAIAAETDTATALGKAASALRSPAKQYSLAIKKALLANNAIKYSGTKQFKGFKNATASGVKLQKIVTKLALAHSMPASVLTVEEVGAQSAGFHLPGDVVDYHIHLSDDLLACTANGGPMYEIRGQSGSVVASGILTNPDTIIEITMGGNRGLGRVIASACNITRGHLFYDYGNPTIPTGGGGGGGGTGTGKVTLVTASTLQGVAGTGFGTTYTGTIVLNIDSAVPVGTTLTVVTNPDSLVGSAVTTQSPPGQMTFTVHTTFIGCLPTQTSLTVLDRPADQPPPFAEITGLSITAICP